MIYVDSKSNSQVEAGKIKPTVSLLKKTLDGVPMGLGEFFSDDLQPQGRMFFRSCELITAYSPPSF